MSSAFAPAPGQAGTLNFSVAVSNGSRSGTIVLPVTVTNPAVPSTEVSGHVVDQDGNPLAGMPVSIGSASAVTNAEGEFTLTTSRPIPVRSARGGSVGSAGRLDLTAPVPQLLGHAVYLGVKNVISQPLILPEIDWSTPASFNQTSAAQTLDITTPAMPGFGIQVPANTAVGAKPISGTVQVAVIPAALAVQHLPPGVSEPLLMYKVSGADLSGPVQLTLPNTSGLASARCSVSSPSTRSPVATTSRA